jgi:hypothetical protein
MKNIQLMRPIAHPKLLAALAPHLFLPTAVFAQLKPNMALRFAQQVAGRAGRQFGENVNVLAADRYT